MAALLQAGFEVYGLEPAAALAAEAEAIFPQLQGRIVRGSLPGDLPVDRVFSAVLCSAVLMHVPAEEWFEAVYALRRLLAPSGRAIIFVSTGRQVDPVTSRDAEGRLFHEPSPEAAQLLFERVGFKLLSLQTTPDRMGRAELRWHVFVFEWPSQVTLPPLDIIQRIIGAESKSATYKLALLRALSEAAARNMHSAVPLADGRVGLPLDLLAEKWLRYYWPLFESGRFIPGANGERPGAAKPLAFRRALTVLVERYRNVGGYPAFNIEWSGAALIGAARTELGEALKRIRRAILDGPVFFAAKGTFTYDSQRRLVTLPFELWREFVQLGFWIEPAVVLEWAVETRRMSKQELTVGEVLTLLTAELEEDRSVADARRTFETAPALACVWSGARLPRVFDVDHAIPFSLWRCNDLWNLLPASPAVNNLKRDRLPTLELVKRSEERIIGNWRLHEARFPLRFGAELSRFLGAGFERANWELTAMRRFREAIEATAVQRRVDPSSRFDLTAA